jgi:D-aminopeptidase
VDEAGRCEGPITLTNTHSVGVARDTTIQWLVQRASKRNERDAQFWLPVAAETYDGELNDINGHHVRPEHVIEAIESARGGAIEEGSVGGGTGMRCYQFKAGSGTASRRVGLVGRTFHVGAFVQANFGRRYMCTIAGVPIGKHIAVEESQAATEETGSIIAVVGTDAPLLPHQLRRLARRPALAMGRSGGVSAHYSGDIFLAFTTRNTHAVREADRMSRLEYLPDQQLTPIFEAAIQAVDEAIITSFVGTPAMTGKDGHTIEGFPVRRAQKILQNYRRLLKVEE